MVSKIRIYVEGGGDQKEGKRWLREGFSIFLNSMRTVARERKIRWNIIACGSRNDACDDFKTALGFHPNAFNVLLVDSEGPVSISKSPWAHLKEENKWEQPADTGDEQCHLMVQLMESWFMADVDALKEFYRSGFRTKRLPKRINIEEIPKPQVISSLERATCETQKGEYHKTRHGPKILKILDPAKVRSRSRHCERLFAVLEEKMQ